MEFILQKASFRTQSIVEGWVGDKVFPEYLFICFNSEGKPITSGNAYFSGRVSFIGSIIADPESSKEERRKANGYLIKQLSEYLKAKGARIVISTPSYDSLTAEFSKEGYTTHSRKVDYVWKGV